MICDCFSFVMYTLIIIIIITTINSDVYWSMKFPSSWINFKMYFRNNFANSFLPRICKDVNWRIFYGQVNVETILRQMNLTSGMCCICKTFEENLEHMMYHCEGIRLMWTEIETLPWLYTMILIYACWICYLETLMMTSFYLMLLMYWFQWQGGKSGSEETISGITKMTFRVKIEIKRHLQMLQSKEDPPPNRTHIEETVRGIR